MSSPISPAMSPEERVRASAEAVAALRDGKLVVMPAEATYAVVADAFSPLATQRLSGAKRRTSAVPLSVVVRGPRQVAGLVEATPEPAERLMAAYWPGPITLVFRAAEGLSWDLGKAQGTVALRMPADDLVVEVVADVGPLAWSAANRTGQPAPSTALEAFEQLGDSVAVYVDGGPRSGPPSTVVDVTGAQAVVLREGAILTAHVAAVASGATGWGQRPEDRDPGGSGEHEED